MPWKCVHVPPSTLHVRLGSCDACPSAPLNEYVAFDDELMVPGAGWSSVPTMSGSVGDDPAGPVIPPTSGRLPSGDELDPDEAGGIELDVVPGVVPPAVGSRDAAMALAALARPA